MPPKFTQHGNIIAAEFRRASIDIQISTQILYCDEAVCLARITYRLDGKVVGTQHVTAEMPH